MIAVAHMRDISSGGAEYRTCLLSGPFDTA